MSENTDNNFELSAQPDAGSKLVGLATPLIGIGAIGCAISFFMDESVFAFSYLISFTFAWTIVLGCLFLIALHHITHAVWSTVFRRIAEGFAHHMWILGLLFLPIVYFLFTDSLFAWSDLTDADQLIKDKEPYLNKPFFLIRGVLFFGIWIAFASFFVGKSIKQDKGIGSDEATKKMRNYSALFMMTFAPTASFAAIDWIMSLEPKWFSTIFGVYIFSGIVLSSLAVVTLSTIWLKKRGALGELKITPDHYYSLGALMFAFTVFWGYVAISQYMLYWYANLPEETFWFSDRWYSDGQNFGAWGWVSILLIFVRFLIPFMMLLSRSSKMSENKLPAICLLILFGQILDMHWLIMPEMGSDEVKAPIFSLHEIGPALLFIGVLIFMLGNFIKKHPPVAVGDPLLEKSRHFHL